MVHRIDLQTSGAVIVAKNPIVVPILNRLISNGQIHRQYLAVVEGEMAQSGKFDWAIGRNPVNPHLHQVNGQNAQPALTYYDTLASNRERSLVKLRLVTGRTHQLRVHLAYSGHQLLAIRFIILYQQRECCFMVCRKTHITLRNEIFKILVRHYRRILKIIW